ncbi:MAG: DUF2085 domain-containing protein [Candidatus Aminicenantes bacterium]|nr:DUF2085 domain-containing protein [Candidatus Aminicenantes bacterium]
MRNERRLVFIYVLTLIGSLIWLAAIMLAPWLSSRSSGLSPFLYACFAPICHQIPSRSFELCGFPMAVCARCLGIYVGFLAGMVLYPIRRDFAGGRLPKTSLFLTVSAPIVLDAAANVLRLWDTPNLLRFFFGFLWGLILPFYFLTGLGELALQVRKK